MLFRSTGLVVGTSAISLLDSAGGVCYDWFPFLPFWFELLFRSPVLPLREGLVCWFWFLGVCLCFGVFFLFFFSGCLGWCRWGEGFVHLVVLGLACGFSVVWCLYLCVTDRLIRVIHISSRGIFWRATSSLMMLGSILLD